MRLNEPHIFFSQLRPKSSKILQDIYKQATEASHFSDTDNDIDKNMNISSEHKPIQNYQIYPPILRSNIYDLYYRRREVIQTLWI